LDVEFFWLVDWEGTMATKKQKDGMLWFITQFGAKIDAAVAGTPFTLSFLTAIATQESFEIWGLIYQKLPVDQVLSLCVGDSIGGPTRKQFPTSKAELLSKPGGAAMYDMARASLAAVGQYVKSYKAAWQQGKFCHGYGIFQYDLQFFKTKPDYFLKKQWADFDMCLAQAILELQAAQKRAKLGGKKTLTDMEMAFVAIAYNAGSVNPAKGLKQGYYNKTDKTYYGEDFWDYFQAAKAIPDPAGFLGHLNEVPAAAARESFPEPANEIASALPGESATGSGGPRTRFFEG
jgi:hypothetical protein